MATDFDRDDRLHGPLRDTLRSQPASGPCVDAATLAAWAEDALTPEETAATDTHLASCARCRELAATLSTMAVAEGAPDAVVVPFTPRPTGRWKVIAGAMGAVAASALIWVAVRDGSPSLDTASEAIREEQTQARGMGGNLPAPAPAAAPLLGAQDSSERQLRADATREAERRQGQQGQTALNAPRPETQLARENNARAATPNQSNTKPSTAPAEPPARTSPSLPPAVAAPTPTPAPPPPPPAAPPPAPTTGAARSSTVAGLPQSTININLDGIKPAEPRQGGFFALPPMIAEFVAGADLVAQQGQALGPAAAGGAGRGGRGGGGGGGAAAAAGGRAAGGAVAGGATEPVRWRLRGAIPDSVTPTMATLERSNDGGTIWQQVPIPVLTTPLLTGGTAPSNSVCWLVGRTGIVLLSTDGTTFRQVTKPVDADLVSVRATDARSATVRTADGRMFTTTDGGVTWTPRSDSPSQ